MRRGPSRRDALGAVSLASLATSGLVPRRAGAAVRFFTVAELAALDELTEVVIPTDAHSPGAKAAGAAREIDRLLASTSARIPDHRKLRALWKEGLALVERTARARHGAGFVGATPEQRRALLGELSAGEKKPLTPGHRFFVELKSATAFAYYTSEIGIHKDIGYKGNSHFDEFQGHDAATVPLGRVRVPGK